MLRCRRCRKGILDSTSLLGWDEDTDESPAAVCSLWHVNVDALPDWMLTLVHQAQWTAGKLNCHNCSARLGGFNFIHHFECPCGQDATVHLNRSRVDAEHQRCLLLVQPRMTASRKDPCHLLPLESQIKESNQTRLQSLNYVAGGAAVSSSSPSPGETSRLFSFSPLYCIRKQRQPSTEDVAAIRSSCFCSTGPADSPSPWLQGTEAGGRARGGQSMPAQLGTAFEAPVSAGPLTSTRRLWRPPQHALEDYVSSVETSDVHEVPGSYLPSRASPGPDTVPEGDEQAEAILNSLALNKLSKREKNRLKGLRRKQRKKERWLHSQLEKAAESLQDSEEDGEGQEGLTCAVCLDIYVCPHVCQPCGHSFCEPCLRTIANNRPMSTPCPLCRTLISHTDFNKELDRTAQKRFPKVYCTRKQNFKSASCAKWPLPSSRKSFCTFWRERRQPVRMGGHWRFHHHGVYSLAAFNQNNMHSGLFNICLVILYVRSANWIFIFLFLSILFYYLWF